MQSPTQMRTDAVPRTDKTGLFKIVSVFWWMLFILQPVQNLPDCGPTVTKKTKNKKRLHQNPVVLYTGTRATSTGCDKADGVSTQSKLEILIEIFTAVLSLVNPSPLSLTCSTFQTLGAENLLWNLTLCDITNCTDSAHLPGSLSHIVSLCFRASWLPCLARLYNKESVLATVL